MRPNLSMPAAAIIPVLEYRDISTALRWLEEPFGFHVRLRIGAHRAQLEFNSGAIVVSENNFPETPLGSGHSVMVRVESVDAHVARARRHGARVVQEPENFPYGERQHTCLDPAGHFMDVFRNDRRRRARRLGRRIGVEPARLTASPGLHMHRPPSTSSTTPVKKFASSLARKSAA